MTNWKKVDADQLDADLTSVADAIRERSGTAEQMNFPDGFVSAVEGITDYSISILNGSIVSYQNELLTYIRASAFANCDKLSSVVLPNVGVMVGYGFQNCYSLTTVDCGSRYIAANSFMNCQKLTTFIIRNTSVATLQNVSAFSSTPIKSGGTGYVYVPRNLVDSYISATNWSTFASQIRAIEDYPEITGG